MTHLLVTQLRELGMTIPQRNGTQPNDPQLKDTLEQDTQVQHSPWI
jgi:hypothetical protein